MLWEQDNTPESKMPDRTFSSTDLDEEGNLHGLLLSLGIQVGAVHDVGEQQHLDEECSCDSSHSPSCGSQGQQVQQEHASVAGPDAVVDPHTVVVKAMHTRPADTSRRQNKALGTSFFK